MRSTGTTFRGGIDVQTHHVPRAAADLIQAWRGKGHDIAGLASGILPGADAHLEAMDEAGISVSVLGFAPLSGIEDDGFRAELCRTANDGLLETCARHPQRFVMAASLPLPDCASAIGELRRVGHEPSVRAVQIVAGTTAYRPEREAFEALFAEAAGLGLPLILHPTAGAVDLAPQFDAYGLGSGLHAMVSHALVALRIMASGMLDRIPALELIVTHLGGILPFLIDRLDSRHKGPSAHQPSHYLRNRLFLDCCGTPAGPALRCALETVGWERLVIGSDWPSRPIAPALAAIRGLDLAPAEEEAILGGNAARWFGPQKRCVNSPGLDSHRR